MTRAGLPLCDASASQDAFGHVWRGQRVTVVGLGRSGVAAATLLRRAGALVRATDACAHGAVREARVALGAIGVEEIETGRHTRELIEGSDVVIVSPGVVESAEPIRWALDLRIPVLSELELAYRFSPSPLIAVTGTNGKSTAVTLITRLLQACGRRAIACGNLGIPLSSVIDQLDPAATAVVEVSSFQLLWCQQFRPQIGVFLNIGTNHLDRHPDQQAYLAAKARLFERQTAQDWAVLNGESPEIAALGERLPSQRVWFGRNRDNPARFHLADVTLRTLTPSAQAVLQVGRLLGIADALAWQVLRGFRGLEHRLEPLATLGGIEFVNDSKSTTPDSLAFALSQTRAAVVAIVGGRNKGLDLHLLAAALRDPKVRGVVLVGETRAALRALLNGSCALRECATLQEAVDAAAELAEPGMTVLFSPGCASFDMFRDFEDRGRAFKQIVACRATAPA